MCHNVRTLNILNGKSETFNQRGKTMRHLNKTKKKNRQTGPQTTRANKD